MSIESELAGRLLGDAGVSALVGARVYPGKAPANAALPYVVWSRTDTDPEDTLNAGGVATADIELECYASTYTEAHALGVAVAAALSGWEGEPPAAIMSAGSPQTFNDYDSTLAAHRFAQAFPVLYRK